MTTKTEGTQQSTAASEATGSIPTKSSEECMVKNNIAGISRTPKGSLVVPLTEISPLPKAALTQNARS